jgi:hypothetical protein
MTEQETYLQCRCGACRITLSDPTMRSRTECLCFDCRQRCLISASKRTENALPDAVANFDRGVDLVYFANALVVDEASQELLEFSKLTADGFNTTAMSSCCGTLMCGTHPMYEGNTISVNADSCRVTTWSTVSVQAVVFACDAPIEQANNIAQHSEVPVFFNVYNELDHPALQALVEAVTAPISGKANAIATTDFEKLCAAKPVTINNAFFEESRAGVSKPPS